MTDPARLKILIADDEPLAAERLQMMLARLEGIHLVGTAHDGESAVRMAETLSPDLVLLDIAMPGLDGIEVARALSRQSHSPAVVFVTAFDQFAVAAFDVAAIDYLMKPVEAGRLARSIERARAYVEGRSVDLPGVGTPSTPASPWLDEFWASDLTGLVRNIRQRGRRPGGAAQPTLEAVSNALQTAAMAMQAAERSPTAVQIAAADAARAQAKPIMAQWTAVQARVKGLK